MFADIGVFNRGLVLGIMIAAPVGAVGLLCIRRTLQRGLLVGFATGLGAAIADAIFGAIAAFSVSVILDFLRHYDAEIRLLGCLFMAIVAWHTWYDKPREPAKNDDNSSDAHDLGAKNGDFAQNPTKKLRSVLSAVVSSLVITMTNPVTLFATLALIATFGELRSSAEAATLVGGLFTGSCLWWVLLSGGISLVRGHFTEGRIALINRCTAVMLAIFALWAGITGIRMILNLV